MKFLTPAHGAEIRRVDSFYRYPGFFQLPAIGPGQIDVPPSLPSEVRRYLRPHLITAFPDAGPYGGMQVLRPRPEAIPHVRDRARGDLRYCSAPTGVDCRHGMQALVGQEDGDAIGGFDGDDAAWAVLQQGVAFP